MKKERWSSLIKKIAIVALLTIVGAAAIMIAMGVFQYSSHRKEMVISFEKSAAIIQNNIIKKINPHDLEKIEACKGNLVNSDYDKAVDKVKETLKEMILLGDIKYVYIAGKKEDTYSYLVDYGNVYVEQSKLVGQQVEDEIVQYLKRAFLGKAFLTPNIMKTDRGYVVTKFIPIDLTEEELSYVLGVEFDMQLTVMQIRRAKIGGIISCIFTEILVIFLSSIIFYNSQKKYELQLERTNNKAESTQQLLLQIASLQSCGILAYTLPERKIMMFNKEALRIYELENESQAEGLKYCKGAASIVLEKDREALQKEIRKIKKVGDMINYRYRVQHKDGKILTILAYTKLVESTEGEKIIISSLLDITEQAKLQDELQFERRQYRDAMVKNSEFAFFVDLSNGIVTKESILQAHAKKGSNIMQNLPMSYDQFTKDWKKVMQPIFEGAESNAIGTRAFLLEKNRQGTTKLEMDCYSISQEAYYRIVILLSENEQNHHVYACIMVMDITELRIEERKAKIALEEACKAANRANKAKSEFLSRMSHDIRTPLNGIMGMLEIADKNIQDIDCVKYCHKKMHIASEYLLEIVNDVLDMSKLEKGKMKFINEPFDFKELLDECMEILMPLAEEKNVHINKVELEQIQHSYIVSSNLHVRQVIMNIISNSIKYNKPNGSITIRVEEAPLEEDKVLYYIYITDTGIGMDEAFQEKMFEPFAQEDEKYRTNFTGTGLGLTIVKQIVDQMGGKINVHSKKNVGSTFIVCLPFKVANIEAMLSEIKVKDYDELLKGKNILIAEDNDINAEIATFMLEEKGMIVARATNGEEVVKLFEASPVDHYDLILMDIMMPIMDGLTATKIIHNLERPDAKKVPIIAMTANAYESDKKASFDAGMCEHIAKPLKQDKVMEVIGKFL